MRGAQQCLSLSLPSSLSFLPFLPPSSTPPPPHFSVKQMRLPRFIYFGNWVCELVLGCLAVGWLCRTAETCILAPVRIAHGYADSRRGSSNYASLKHSNDYRDIKVTRWGRCSSAQLTGSMHFSDKVGLGSKAPCLTGCMANRQVTQSPQG